MRAPQLGAGVLIFWIAALSPLKADPLPPEACTALSAERDALIADGVKSDRDHGPDWAKTNLPPERLRKIEKLIETEEQLSFRCDVQVTARPTLAKPSKNAEPEADRPDTGAKAKAATDEVPPVKKKKKRRTATAPADAPAETPGAGDTNVPAETGSTPAKSTTAGPEKSAAPQAAKPADPAPAKTGQNN